MRIQGHRWQKLATRLLDFVYTPQCALCGVVLRDGRSLCDSCNRDLPRLPRPFCEKCGEPFHGHIEGPFQCPNCGELDFAFGFARPVMLRDERTRLLIHQLKYGRAIHLASELGRLAAEAFDDERLGPALQANWPLVPVPLHRARLQHRNFNQATEIARVVAKHTALPVLAALKRIRRTDTQALLGRRARLNNLRGAFALTSAGRRHLANPASGTGAILIDDVLTTGSTVEACAATLRRAGFKCVLVVTVMRG
ncbi:MAG: ComF family protein [Verrucomicrobia bacterium]|nr:MAG: ComF family protein [Verrucomicrobiota bacterium]